MYDYPNFDGTQACHGEDLTGPAARAFAGAAGADPAPALLLCLDCAFLTECGSYALTHEVYGVWGGTTEDRRDEIRAANGVPAPSSTAGDLDQLVTALSHETSYDRLDRAS